MNPIQFPGFNAVFGAEQPEYLPLPAYRNPDNGAVTACWEMTAEERAVVAATGCVYVTLMMFGAPLTPSHVSVTPPEGVPALAPDLVPASFDMLAHLARQREWSARTFGPGPRTAGVIDHIRKELDEIAADPDDLKEWIDVVILALDGAWRAGHSPEAIVAALEAKQAKNEARTWPDWRTADPDKAIEHDRTSEVP